MRRVADVPAPTGYLSRVLAVATGLRVRPGLVTGDGTLFVDVATSAWMQELSRMEPQLLKARHQRPRGAAVQRIHWRVARVAGPLLVLVR